MAGHDPRYMIVDEVASIDEAVLAGVAQAYGARAAHECPDCESHWDRGLEPACPTCGLTVADLTARLARGAS